MATVFLYEDDPRLNPLAVEALQAAGFETISACDGVEFQEVALGQLMAIPADEVVALVVDLWVPVFTGFDVIERLRADAPQLRGTPLVIWTDNPTPQAHPRWVTVQPWLPREILVKAGTPEESVRALVELIQGL